MKLRVPVQIAKDEILSWSRGKALGELPQQFSGVSLNSQDVVSGDIFVALKGSRDGNQFIENARLAGAKAVLTQNVAADQLPAIQVNDSREALLDIARAYRKKWGQCLVAISGSNGKTTVKDFLATLLRSWKKTQKTPGNWNNLLGLPLTLLSLKSETEIAVVEMGMNALGEIRTMTEAALPDMVCLTNIGKAHIGELGSFEGIIEAKSELFRFCPPHALLIINKDDKHISAMAETLPNRKVFFSVNAGSGDVHVMSAAEGTSANEIQISYGNQKWNTQFKVPGEHNLHNFVAALALAYALGCPFEQIKAATQDLALPSMRMQKKVWGSSEVWLDCYNANPDSFKAGVAFLSDLGPKRCAVVGDMKELGEFAAQEHEGAGKLMAELEVDRILILKGEFGQHTLRGVKEMKNDKVEVRLFDTKSDLQEEIFKLKDDEWNVWVKASRSEAFEDLFYDVDEEQS